MKKIIKNYPLTLLVISVILFLSLFNPPKTKLDPITNIDKIAHICMYGGLELIIWFEYLRSHSSLNLKKIILWGVIAPIVLGGLMELAQMYLTSNRSGDWADLAADAIGVLLGAIIGSILLRRWIRYRSNP
ncbi:MAG: VanZ family protein [Bacteroidaceae bacterium]|nr:VanZ family protein [Bacteroidaceae bacterium]